MKRTKTKSGKKVTAILTADWHLQEGQAPVCRMDDFESVQWRKLRFLANLQQEHNCMVWHSGDLFDFWKPSPELLSKVIEYIPNNFVTVYGNHDLPQHNIELQHKSGINVLKKANIIDVFNTCHWLEEPETSSAHINGKDVLIWHVPVYQGKAPYPGCEWSTGKRLLKKYPQYDLILTGDVHIPFIEEYEGRLLVNPGSIFRTTASQEEHRPRVYLWCAETNTVEIVYIPIEEGVISREHIEKQQDRENRIDAFISGLDTDWEAEMTFEENLERYKELNKTKPEVMEIIYKSIEL